MKISTFLCTIAFSNLSFADSTEFFIGCRGSDVGKPGIYFSSIDEETGKLSPPKKLIGFEGAGFQALNSDGSLLASTASDPDSGGNVRLFSVSANGDLTPKGASSCGKGQTAHVSFDSSGKVIFAANYRDGSISSSLIDSDGTLKNTTSLFQHEGKSVHPKRQKSPHAHSIYAGPKNKFVYVPDLGIDATVIYSLDSETGILKKIGQAEASPGSGPRHMKFGKNGNQAYVLNELNTSLTVFDVQEDGLLKKKQNLSTLPKDAETNRITCSEVRVSPDGQFIYTANRDTSGAGRDTLSVLKINPTDGNLTLIQNLPAGVIIPRNITLTPSGKWLVTSGQKSNNLTVFSVNPDTGKLTQTKDSTPCPSPMCVTFR